MANINSAATQNIVNALKTMVFNPNFGIYPEGFRSGGIAFGMNESALTPRKPLVATDGSPQSVFKAEESDTFRAQIEGMSLVSRDATGRGLFPEIRLLEKRLNVSAGEIYRLAGDGDPGLEEFRPGLGQRMRRYGELSIREVVRRACQSATLPNEERIYEFGKDLMLISELLRGRDSSAPELFFTSGVLLAASGGWAGPVAVSALKSAAWLFFDAKRPNAAAVTADLALNVIEDSGMMPEQGDSFAPFAAQAWLASAEEFAGDRSAAMIARFRGIAAALSGGEHGIAARLYRLEADSAGESSNRGKGFARAAWALGRAVASGSHSAPWPLVAEHLRMAAEAWNGVNELASERDHALRIAELADRL